MNVEVVKRFYAAIERYLSSFDNGEALAAALAEEREQVRADTIREAQRLIAEDAVWETSWSSAPFHGPMGIIDYGVGFTDSMREWRWEIDSFTEVGRHVIVDVTVYTRGKASGVPTEQRMWNVFDVNDGRITRYREFVDEAGAQAAVSGEGGG